jgi:hypothetical protein
MLPVLALNVFDAQLNCSAIVDQKFVHKIRQSAGLT